MLMMLQTLQRNKIALSIYFCLGWPFSVFENYFCYEDSDQTWKSLSFMMHLFIKIWILETLKSWNIECLMIYWLSSSCSKDTYIIQNHQMPKSLHSTFLQSNFKSVINYLNSNPYRFTESKKKWNFLVLLLRSIFCINKNKKFNLNFNLANSEN